MKDKFVYVSCSICGSEEYTKIYSSIQNVSDVIKEAQVDVVMCKNCSFLFNNPRPNEKLLEEHYKINSSGTVYKKVDPSSRGGRLTKLRLDFVNKHMVNKTNGRILDIGCGNGFFLEALKLNHWKKTGIDLSPDAGMRIKDKSIEFIETDILNFNPEEKYDLITCFSSFEHFYAPEVILNKISSLLSPDGVLIVDIPDTEYPVTGLEEYFCLEHLSHFTRRTFEMFCNKNKFELIEFDTPTKEFQNILCSIKINPQAQFTHLEDVAKIKEIIKEFSLENRNLKEKIFNILDESITPIKARKKKIAIYGAGFHNYFLYNLFSFEDCVDCFIDSDPKKWTKKFMGLDIKSPTVISELEVEAIVISSHHFENEIFDTIMEYNSRKIPVLKLYNESFE